MGGGIIGGIDKYDKKCLDKKMTSHYFFSGNSAKAHKKDAFSYYMHLISKENVFFSCFCIQKVETFCFAIY